MVKKSKCHDEYYVGKKKINIFENVSVGNDGEINGVNIYKKKINLKFELKKDDFICESQEKLSKYLDENMSHEYSILLSSVRIEFNSKKSDDMNCIIKKIGTIDDPEYFFNTDDSNIDLNNFVYIYRSLSNKPIKKLLNIKNKKISINFLDKITNSGTLYLNLLITYFRD